MLDEQCYGNSTDEFDTHLRSEKKSFDNVHTAS